jgi:hypothetical protein
MPYGDRARFLDFFQRAGLFRRSGRTETDRGCNRDREHCEVSHRCALLAVRLAIRPDITQFTAAAPVAAWLHDSRAYVM